MCGYIWEDRRERLGKEGTAYQDDLKEHFLIHLHEFLVPFVDIRRLLPGVRVVILGSGGVLAVMLAPLDDFLHDGFVDL